MTTFKAQTNSESTYVKIVKEICAENDINLKSFSYDWIFELSKNEHVRYILGYQFDLNTAAAQAICKDKSATTDILLSHGIPCVEHSFFMSPTNVKYLGIDGSWTAIKELKNNNFKIVCKPNEGTGGNNVFVVSTQKELEFAVDRIFKNSRSMAVCPYYDIQNEYRIIILNNNVKLIFSKQRPFITGDGFSPLAQLLYKYIESNKLDDISIDLGERTLQTILEKGERFTFNWKHNLGQGSKAVIFDDEPIKSQLIILAQKASQVLNLKFASIDIICENDTYRILEINSGVMMEHFSSQSEECYTIAKKIYKEAINLMFT